MGFYELNKDKRDALRTEIRDNILIALRSGDKIAMAKYFSDADPYVRKAAYFAVGKIYNSGAYPGAELAAALKELFESKNEKVRQTAIYAAGEIAKKDYPLAEEILEAGLFDCHHSVRNAVIGSLKKIGEVNHEPVVMLAIKYAGHPDPEIRRQIVHGLELRGRTHPEDVLPVLKLFQNETASRVKNMAVHVIGQISYKRGCLEKVLSELETWENISFVKKAAVEIIDVHENYCDFSALSPGHARERIMVCLDKLNKPG